MSKDSPRSRSSRAKDLHRVARLSPVSVRARAVIPYDGGIVVACEKRRGRPHVTLPGGRVAHGEEVAATVLREVHEETGLRIELGPLLYVAEVTASVTRQDLNLIFLSAVVEDEAWPGAEIVRPEDGDVELLPPLLDRIRRDQRRGWSETGAWLGNVWRGELDR